MSTQLKNMNRRQCFSYALFLFVFPLLFEEAINFSSDPRTGSTDGKRTDTGIAQTAKALKRMCKVSSKCPFAYNDNGDLTIAGKEIPAFLTYAAKCLRPDLKGKGCRWLGEAPACSAGNSKGNKDNGFCDDLTEQVVHFDREGSLSTSDKFSLSSSPNDQENCGQAKTAPTWDGDLCFEHYLEQEQVTCLVEMVKAIDVLDVTKTCAQTVKNGKPAEMKWYNYYGAVTDFLDCLYDSGFSVFACDILSDGKGFGPEVIEKGKGALGYFQHLTGEQFGFGAPCNSGYKQLCCPKPESGTGTLCPDHCEWYGEAPYCAGGEATCDATSVLGAVCASAQYKPSWADSTIAPWGEAALAGKDGEGHDCMTGEKKLCCSKHEMCSDFDISCGWHGTAPFCSAGDFDCNSVAAVECGTSDSDPQWDDAISTDPDFGDSCLSGKKKLCCPTQEMCPQPYCEWVGTAPYCSAGDFNCADIGKQECTTSPDDPSWDNGLSVGGKPIVFGENCNTGVKKLCCPTGGMCPTRPCGWQGRAPSCSSGDYNCNDMGMSGNCPTARKDPPWDDGMSLEPSFGDKCTSGEKKLCCPTQADCPENICQWVGKAPGCSAGDYDCREAGFEHDCGKSKKDPDWDGGTPFGDNCMSGNKKLCCSDSCPS